MAAGSFMKMLPTAFTYRLIPSCNQSYSAKRGCSSVGRAPALQAGGHEFESHHLHEATSTRSVRFALKAHRKHAFICTFKANRDITATAVMKQDEVLRIRASVSTATAV